MFARESLHKYMEKIPFLHEKYSEIFFFLFSVFLWILKHRWWSHDALIASVYFPLYHILVASIWSVLYFTTYLITKDQLLWFRCINSWSEEVWTYRMLSWMYFLFTTCLISPSLNPVQLLITMSVWWIDCSDSINRWSAINDKFLFIEKIIVCQERAAMASMDGWISDWLNGFIMDGWRGWDDGIWVVGWKFG